MKIQCKKLDAAAKLPTRATPGSNGYDLYTTKETTVYKGIVSKIPTGISMAIPAGYAGIVWDKSGLAVKRGLKVMAGLIDSDYRGEVMVCLTKLTDGEPPATFQAGEKVAQMIIVKTEDADWSEVENLDDTVRGDGGFGHTGNK